jgi:hypothetical protein
MKSTARCKSMLLILFSFVLIRMAAPAAQQPEIKEMKKKKQE